MENTTTKLVQIYLSARFSPASEEKLQQWLISSRNEEEKEKASLLYWNSLETRPTRNTYTSLEKVENRIGIHPKKHRTMFSRKWITAAATLVMILLAGGSYMWYTTPKNIYYKDVYAAYGETKHIELPDGSTIWLNSGTTIRYPEKFTGKERNVYLDGEAFFTIRKDSLKPFIVHTGQLTVNVLGTVFNLKSFSDEHSTIATLESGKITISTSTGHSQVLVPGQQLSFNHLTSQITLREISAEEASAWKDGYINFIDMNLVDILKGLSRHFNLTLQHTELDIDTKYNIKFNKDESIEHILSVLSEMSNYTLSRKKNSITAVPK